MSCERRRSSGQELAQSLYAFMLPASMTSQLQISVRVLSILDRARTDKLMMGSLDATRLCDSTQSVLEGGIPSEGIETGICQLCWLHTRSCCCSVDWPSVSVCVTAGRQPQGGSRAPAQHRKQLCEQPHKSDLLFSPSQESLHLLPLQGRNLAKTDWVRMNKQLGSAAEQAAP